MKKFSKLMGLLGVFASALLLSGCDFDVFSPAGHNARVELNLLLICVAIMLCVVVPVMVAIVVFAFKYRHTNTDAVYKPDWSHSNKLEVVMWGIPIIIIIALGTMTYRYTHALDPAQPISKEIAGDATPLQIDAVALDWKWLFIYPQYGVATINEIYAPVDRQVLVQVTSENTLNAFWVPKLGTILYAMPQMSAKLHLIADQQGVFKGTSANYSGDGFSHMRFQWHSVSQSEFDDWIVKVSKSPTTLDHAEYAKLRVAPMMGDIQKKEKDAEVRYFSNVSKDLYYKVVNRCVDDGSPCNEDQMKLAAAQTLWGELCSVFDPVIIQKK